MEPSQTKLIARSGHGQARPVVRFIGRGFVKVKKFYFRSIPILRHKPAYMARGPDAPFLCFLV